MSVVKEINIDQFLLTSSPWDIRDGSTSQSGLRLLISRIFSVEVISTHFAGFLESHEPPESPEACLDSSFDSQDMPLRLPALLEQNEK